MSAYTKRKEYWRRWLVELAMGPVAVALARAPKPKPKEKKK